MRLYSNVTLLNRIAIEQYFCQFNGTVLIKVEIRISRNQVELDKQIIIKEKKTTCSDETFVGKSNTINYYYFKVIFFLY